MRVFCHMWVKNLLKGSDSDIVATIKDAVKDLEKEEPDTIPKFQMSSE